MFFHRLYRATCPNYTQLEPKKSPESEPLPVISYKWGEITPLIDPIYKAIYRGHLAEILVQNKFLEGRIDACWIGN